MTRILVTGASGFVGHRLAPALLKAFPDAELALAGWSEMPGGGVPGAKLLTGSLLDATHLDALAATAPDVVVHLAARSSVAGSLAAAYETMGFNLGGTLRFAEILRKKACPSGFVFASSAEVYGHTFNEGPAKEGSPLRPANAYARSKAACEWALGDMLGDVSHVCNLRLFNHSGPGQDVRFVLPAFAAQIASAEQGLTEPVIRVGNLSAERDFLHIDDVVTAYVRSVAFVLGRDPGVTTLNIASGQPTSIQSILDRLLQLANVEMRVEADPHRLRPSEVPIAVGDATLAREWLDWVPRLGLDTLLADVLDYWRSQPR